MRRGLMVGLQLRRALLAGFGAMTYAMGPAQADTLNVHYAVSLIGLSLGTASLSATLDPGRVQDSRPLRAGPGLASIISNSRGIAISTGSLAAAQPLPATYATTSSSSQMTRTVRMALNAGSVRGVDISPPIESAPDRIPVTEGQKRGIIDPLSALLMPVPRTDPCNRAGLLQPDDPGL